MGRFFDLSYHMTETRTCWTGGGGGELSLEGYSRGKHPIGDDETHTLHHAFSHCVTGELEVHRQFCMEGEREGGRE